MTAEAAPDEQLLQAYAAGDARAFEALYNRHGLRVWRFVFRSIGDQAAADDVMQDVWFRVARQAGRYEPRARFTTWLFTLAHHRMIDYLHLRRPDISLDSDTGEERFIALTLAADSGFGPVRRIETRQQAARLLQALAALPAEQREAFLLQAEGGMSVAEIASATGVGTETAKSRLRYARAALRRTLEQLA